MRSPRPLVAWLLVTIAGTAALLAPTASEALLFLLEAPLVAALGLLGWRTTRQAGVGVALGSTATQLTAITAVFSAAFVTPLVGPPTARGLATLVLLAGTFVSALRARDSDRAKWGGAAGLAAALLAVAALAVVTRASGRWQQARRASESSSELDYAARRAGGQIHRCAKEYAAKDRSRGYPGSLSALGPDGSGCLPADVARGRSRTHLFSYLPALPDHSGVVRDFTVCARPIQYGVSGKETWVIDAAGRIGSAPNGAEATTTCAASWDSGNDYLSGVKHCVFDYAARYPDQGYPDALARMGADGTGCLALPGGLVGDALRRTCDAQGERCRKLVYLPGLPDTDRRVRSFTLAFLGAGGAYTDESGVVRAARDAGSARRPDPVVSQFPQQPWPEGPSAANQARLERKCAQEHRWPYCRYFAESLLATADAGPVVYAGERMLKRQLAADWLAKACDADDAESCLRFPEVARQVRWRQDDGPFLSRGRDDACSSRGSVEDCRAWTIRLAGVERGPDPQQLLAAWEKACRLGQGRGCWAAADLRLTSEDPRSRSEARPLLDRGCTLDHAPACVALGRELLTGTAPARDARRAARLFDRVCGGGDPSGCGPLGALFLNGDGVAVNRRLARHLLRRGCALAEDARACEILRGLTTDAAGTGAIVR